MTSAYPVASERLYIKWMLLALALLEALSFTNLCQAPHGFIKPLTLVGWLNVVLFIYLGAVRGPRPLLVCLGAGGVALGVLTLAAAQLPFDGRHTVEYALAAAGVVALIHTSRLAKAHPGRDGLGVVLLHGYALAVLLSVIGPTLLSLTFTLHPRTHDFELFRLDSAYGALPAGVLATWARSHPTLGSIIKLVYDNGTSPLLFVYGLQLAKRATVSIKLADVAIISVFGALLLFHVYPVAGPIHVFGRDFPDALPRPEDLPLVKSLVFPVPRNGVPSIHFGWALVTWLIATREGPLVRTVCLLLAVITAIATLALGEHYLVDLVVALPFMLAVMALCSTRQPWGGIRGQAVAWGSALYAGWLLLMGRAIPALEQAPALLWLASLATVAVSTYGFVKLLRAPVSATAEAGAAAGRVAPLADPSAHRLWLLFFVSGAAALVYQVLFSKQLAYVFGSMSAATNTVLATYMGGMAIGAWLGGMLASRLARPVLAYAICEFLIAIYCAATPAIFALMKHVYVGLAHGSAPDAPELLGLRVVIGAAGLVLPTVLMGMTLPILARFFESREASLGISVGRLYTANTLGASVGAILAGYLIIPAIGLRSTTLVAIAANLLVAFLAVQLHKSLGAVAAGAASSPASHERLAPAVGWLAILVLTVGGFVTLALEVNDIHLLAVAAGNSTYAFSLMLFAFLVGLGGGAEIGRRLLQHFRPVPLLLWLEAGLCVAILWSVMQIDGLPAYFAGFAGYPVRYGFSAREVIRAIACLLAMLPPALLIGALFPVAIECLGRAFPERRIVMLGAGAAMNTVGNILGVLAAGFVLLPMAGALRLAELLAALCLVLGVVVAVTMGQWRDRRALAALGVAGAAFAFQPRSLDYDSLSSGANVYFHAQNWGSVIDHAESLDGGLTTVNRLDMPNSAPLLTLLTNGKFQGNNAPGGEMIAQSGFAMAPLLHVARRNRGLVIGYGTGNTSRILHDAGFAQLDIVDISADIFRLANRHFPGVNGRVTERPGVRSYVTDGRNFLLLSNQRYDLISMEISSIWFAGAAALYNRDFYRLAAGHLTEQGVLQQWVQLHHITPLDILFVIGSIRDQFRYVWLYVIGGQGVIVATNSAAAVPSGERIRELAAIDRLKDLYVTPEGRPQAVAAALLLRPEQVDRMLGARAKYLVSTDDNAHLEYSTPKGNVLDTDKSMRASMAFLEAAAGGGEPSR